MSNLVEQRSENITLWRQDLVVALLNGRSAAFTHMGLVKLFVLIQIRDQLLEVCRVCSRYFVVYILQLTASKKTAAAGKF